MRVAIHDNVSKSYVSAQITSAGVDHLIHGIGAITMVSIVEAMVIHAMLNNDIRAGLTIALIIQFAAIYFIRYAIKYLTPLTRKVEFYAYFSRLEDGVEINGIRECYNIMLIDDYGVVFTNALAMTAIEDWLLVNKGSPTKRIERILREASE